MHLQKEQLYKEDPVARGLLGVGQEQKKQAYAGLLSSARNRGTTRYCRARFETAKGNG